MKSQEELNELKREVKKLNKTLAELTDEELVQISGGGIQYDWRDYEHGSGGCGSGASGGKGAPMSN